MNLKFSPSSRPLSHPKNLCLKFSINWYYSCQFYKISYRMRTVFYIFSLSTTLKHLQPASRVSADRYSDMRHRLYRDYIVVSASTWFHYDSFLPLYNLYLCFVYFIGGWTSLHWYFLLISGICWYEDNVFRRILHL